MSNNLSKEEKEILKLSKLCQHWANHNNSHKESFSKWRNIATKRGLDLVAKNLDNAIEMIEKCSEYLLSASKDLENK